MKFFLKKHWAAGLFSLFSLFCLLLFFLFRFSTGFSRWFSTVPARWVRLILGGISRIIPFSLFEFLIGAFLLYLMVLLGISVAMAVRKLQKKPLIPRFFTLLTVPVITLVSVFDLFCLSFAPCYFRPSAAQELGLRVEEVSSEDVFLALEGLRDVINETAPHLEKNEKGESLPSEKLSQIKQKVVDACDAFARRNEFFQEGGYPAKSFLVSPWMTYTHISGVFGFFTGEANVNTNYPHFTVTAALAHESCHARGIAPENECNFLAAVILMESGDPYLAYCGANALYDNLYNTARRLDRERAYRIFTETDPVLQKDWIYFNEFFKPYADSPAADVAADIARILADEAQHISAAVKTLARWC